jgi:PelA/Pel-15E family pectate lyase
MINVMRLLREIAREAPSYAFVDESRRARTGTAVRKGIDCILKCQVVVNGKRTAWCAQHDAQTLAPAPARSYELPSLSGSESVPIVRFLMEVDDPSDPVIEAIEAAVAWLETAKLTGIRVVEKRDPSLRGGRDRVVLQDPSAPPLWARFYEIGTNRPFFCGRDGIVKYTLAEIEHERRTGYSWYSERPADLLTKAYPAWKARLAQGNRD